MPHLTIQLTGARLSTMADSLVSTLPRVRFVESPLPFTPEPLSVEPMVKISSQSETILIGSYMNCYFL